MDFPEHLVHRPRRAYKKCLELVKRKTNDEKEARALAMALMNQKYNTSTSVTSDKRFEWIPPPGWSARWWCGDLKEKRLCIKKTKQEGLRDDVTQSSFQWRIQQCKNLMEKLLVAKKYGEDISPYINEAHRISNLKPFEEHKERFFERRSRNESSDTRCIESAATEPTDADDKFLQFYLEMTTESPVVSDEMFTNDFKPSCESDCLEDWDLPPASTHEAELVEAYLDDNLP